MALQEDQKYRRITIIGGGTSGYLSTLFLAKKFPSIYIDWIYPKENNNIGVGEALVPIVSNFLKDLGISIWDILLHCEGTLKLGVVFDGFNQPNESFVYPFAPGGVEKMINLNKISNDIQKYKHLISVHMKVTKLLEYLDDIINTLPNVNIVRSEIMLSEIDQTDNLIVDCTGFNRNILSISDNFFKHPGIFNNNALIFRHTYSDIENQQLPYSIFKAMEYGWCWHIPLQHELVIGYVHDVDFIEKVEVEFQMYIKQMFGVNTSKENYRQVPMKGGRNKVHLKDNIVAIGLSSNFIEPIESTGLYLVVDALLNLKKYIDNVISEETYNNNINYEFDTITEFIICHYKFSKRNNVYWNRYKEIDVPLRHTARFLDDQIPWDYVLFGFLPNIVKPTSAITDIDLINIHKGPTFHKWLKNFISTNEKNIS